MTQVKICGLTRPEDIRCVNRLRPSYIGFILNFEKSRRNLAPSEAAGLRRSLAPGIRAVGVMVDQPIDTAVELAHKVGLDVIQLHGGEDDSYIAALRARAGVPVWKAFRVRTAADLDSARRSAADQVLLDNGYGTGETFLWDLADGFDRPFILAGGLTPLNVADAIRQLKPSLVDVSSGVETDGRKDPQKIAAFMDAVRKGDEL